MLKLVLACCYLAAVAHANFIDDPKCPPAQAAGSCAGRRSNCWSPGVRYVGKILLPLFYYFFLFYMTLFL